jgi:protoporphyrinogen oxidase
LRAHHQGPRAIESLWDLITLPTVNLPAEEASLALAARVFRTGLLDDNDGGDVGWSRVPLQHLHGDAAAAALAGAGVEVVLSTSVSHVDGTTVVAATDGRSFDADAVVVAFPHDVAAAVLPTGAVEGAERLGASAIVNVHLVLDRRVTDLPFAAVVGSPLQFVFDRTESSGATEGQCLAVSLSAADAYLGWPTSALVRHMVDALGEVFPAARAASVRDATVVREPRATFRGVPGTGSLRPTAATPIPGVFVAGAWTATGWPATMEGAVRSGRAAARAALAVGQAAPIRLGGSQ